MLHINLCFQNSFCARNDDVVESSKVDSILLLKESESPVKRIGSKEKNEQKILLVEEEMHFVRNTRRMKNFIKLNFGMLFISTSYSFYFSFCLTVYTFIRKRIEKMVVFSSMYAHFPLK